MPPKTPVPREVFRVRPRLGDVIVIRIHTDDLPAFENPDALAELVGAFGRDVKVLAVATSHPIEITAVDGASV